ncbi:hypothetical protein KHP32_22905, partial [Cronobacter sakazakii]|uniref:hypothetical protein n=1 Tax=Cronobacter sakazakii TaxID=28141 RepID=UPI001BCB2601
MSGRDASFRSIIVACAATAAFVAVAPQARAQAVTLDVTFRLTDLEYRGLPNLPVRIVFGSQRYWQDPSTGKRFVTDAKGEARLTFKVELDERQR